jgi:Tol biopolymer transport system component
MRLTTQTSRGDVLDSALSADGRFLADLAVRAGARGSLRVRQVASGSDVEVLPASEAAVGNPSFSPDGNYVFYTASRPERPTYRALFQVPSLGGTPQERGFDVDSRVSFSPDGKRLVFLRSFMEKAETRLIVLDLASGKERTLASVSGPGQERFQGAPSWSRDGKRIAALVVRAAPDLESTIALFDAESGSRQDLAKLGRTMLTSLAWLKDDSGLVSSGTELNTSLVSQVLLHAFPDGRPVRITNDFNQYNNVSAAGADDTVAAVRNNIRSNNFWIADAAGAPARRLTSIANPENSPSGNFAHLTPETIVYAAVEDRSMQLWSLATKGGEPRRLTSGEAHSLNPRVGGGQLFFDRLDASGMHVWRAGIDGATPRVLTTGPGEQQVNVSRDGQHLVIVHFESPNKVSVIAQDGRVVLSVPDASGQPLGIAPDSKSVIIGKAEKGQDGLSKQVWRVFALAGGAVTTTFALPSQAFNLRWAPDSRGVTFLNGADPVRNVYRQALAGGEPQQVTRFAEGRLTSHGWSPDGRRLAVRIQAGDTSNLWLTQADGSRSLQVTQFPGEIFGFDWLPDSSGLVVSAGTSSWDAVLIRGFR